MRFSMIIRSKNRICEENKIVFNKIEIYIGKKMQYLHLNNVGEYQLLIPYFNKKGIIWKKSALYTQDQNRVVERPICIIIKKAHTILIHIGLPSKLWPKALSATCYITSRLPIKVLKEKTPFEAQYKRKSDIFNLCIYGCNAYIIDYKAKAKGKIAS